jgi:hypothetical protein
MLFPRSFLTRGRCFDLNGAPLVSREEKDANEQEKNEHSRWARHYIEVRKCHSFFTYRALFEMHITDTILCDFQAIERKAPQYLQAIKTGKDARHIWFTFKHWKGGDPEGYFGALGGWAEDRLKEIGQV